jgi:hypothetical protein
MDLFLKFVARWGTVVLRNLVRNNRPLFATGLAATAGLFCFLALIGCGTGVANLPGVTKPAAGVPSGPVLGYVFSSTDGTLRAMLGVRGSAQMSASIVPVGIYVAGEASTASSTALLEDANGSLFEFDLPMSQPLRVTDGVAANAKIVFSPSGLMAVAYGGSKVMLITGLPATPSVKMINVATATSAVIVSDAGTVVVASGGSVGTLSANGQFSRLATLSAFGGFNFLPGSDDMLVADSSADTVSLVHSVSTAPTVQALTVAGLNKPVAVAASKDGKWAIVVNSGDAGLLRVDLATGTAATKLLCACQPSQLSALAGGAAFRVNPLYAGPVWTVDLTPAASQMLFVPAIGKETP